MTEAELSAGRAAYIEVKQDFLRGRIPLHKKSFVECVYAFIRANYAPFWVPVGVATLLMMRSGGYAPAPQWVNNRGGGVDPYKHDIWQLMVDRPQEATLAIVDALFYEEPEFRKVKGGRYWGGVFCLSDVQQKLECLWKAHVYEHQRMFAAMNALRAKLQEMGFPMQPSRDLELVFLHMMPTVLDFVDNCADAPVLFCTEGEAEVAREGMMGGEEVAEEAREAMDVDGAEDPDYIPVPGVWS
jgi:hypothetical protein